VVRLADDGWTVPPNCESDVPPTLEVPCPLRETGVPTGCPIGWVLFVVPLPQSGLTVGERPIVPVVPRPGWLFQPCICPPMAPGWAPPGGAGGGGEPCGVVGTIDLS